MTLRVRGNRVVRRAAPGGVAVLLAALVVPQHVGAASLAQAAAPGGSYRAVTAQRVLDTRSGLGAPKGPKTSVDLVVAGKAGVPTAGASAVAVNITVTQPSTAGYVTAYATGTSRPITPAVRYVAQQTVAAMTVVPVSAAGSITLFSSASTQLILDVQGYFTDVATADSRGLFTADAARLMDTRSGLGGTAPGPGATVSLQVTGRGGVPSTGVTAAVVNILAAGPTTSGLVVAYPTGRPRPAVSTINFTRGETRANRAIVPVGAGGKISLYNAVGTTQLVVDVAGYFSDITPDTGSYYVPIAPTRLLDSRISTPIGWSGLPGATNTLDVTVDGLSPGRDVGPVPTVHDVAPPVAAWVTITSVNPARSGTFTLYGDGARPSTTDLYAQANRTIANSGPVRISSAGAVTAYDGVGEYAVFDIHGYFAQAPKIPTPTGLWTWGVPGYGSAYHMNSIAGLTAVVGGLIGYAVAADGTLRAWTRPSFSNGLLRRVSIASDPAVRDITQLASSGAAVFALRTDGTVWAWGSDVYGEFGNDTQQNSVFTTYGQGTITPQTAQVSISDVTLVGAASNTGYAVKADGTVWAWGFGGTGQLGNGGTADSHVPVQVSGLTGVRSIAGGTHLTYAIDGDGHLWRWGRLTTSSGITTITTPQKITGGCANGVSVVANIAGGWELCDDGTVWQLDYTGRESFGGTTYFGHIASLDHVAAISSAVGPFADGIGRGMQALRDDRTVWRFDPTINAYRPVYGLNGIKVIGGSISNAYAVA
jgi:hypothetical protein